MVLKRLWRSALAYRVPLRPKRKRTSPRAQINPIYTHPSEYMGLWCKGDFDMDGFSTFALSFFACCFLMALFLNYVAPHF